MISSPEHLKICISSGSLTKLIWVNCTRHYFRCSMNKSNSPYLCFRCISSSDLHNVRYFMIVFLSNPASREKSLELTQPVVTSWTCARSRIIYHLSSSIVTDNKYRESDRRCLETIPPGVWKLNRGANYIPSPQQMIEQCRHLGPGPSTAGRNNNCHNIVWVQAL